MGILRQRKLGILGGTFNPIHWGHLLMAETALEQFALNQIIWVPTYCPPHKRDQELLGFEHRMEMVRRAIADHPDFMASDVEMQRGGVSYAIATLNALDSLYADTQWHWILGMDAFQSLPHWQNSAAIAAQCRWLVAPRSTQDAEIQCQQVAAELLIQSIQLRWHVLHMPQVEISSSLVRERYQMGRSLRYWVPEPVRRYIITHNLYQNQTNQNRTCPCPDCS
ncbi:MAG: nicotinate (nicotinamide) nucleotide adenylyltransferase [Leptolyngbyaceae cyanobacterium RU_5_1]|nr:nicotinate (nicotinamide) nucleotide adenylyltransferase [Leptolyngbyaceae cyanobacterium RU_5_1]